MIKLKWLDPVYINVISLISYNCDRWPYRDTSFTGFTECPREDGRRGLKLIFKRKQNEIV
jgi:hypothetical protein